MNDEELRELGYCRHVFQWTSLPSPPRDDRVMWRCIRCGLLTTQPPFIDQLAV